MNKKRELKRYNNKLRSKRNRKRLKYLRKMWRLNRLDEVIMTPEEIKNKDKILSSL